MTAPIDDYLAGLDTEDARFLGDAYAIARELLPDAEQGMSYGMPALIWRGKPVLSLMRAKGHIGLYPYSQDAVSLAMAAVAPIDGVSSSKGTIRLPLGRPLPAELVTAVVTARADQVAAAPAKAPRHRSAT